MYQAYRVLDRTNKKGSPSRTTFLMESEEPGARFGIFSDFYAPEKIAYGECKIIPYVWNARSVNDLVWKFRNSLIDYALGVIVQEGDRFGYMVDGEFTPVQKQKDFPFVRVDTPNNLYACVKLDDYTLNPRIELPNHLLAKPGYSYVQSPLTAEELLFIHSGIVKFLFTVPIHCVRGLNSGKFKLLESATEETAGQEEPTERLIATADFDAPERERRRLDKEQEIMEAQLGINRRGYEQLVGQSPLEDFLSLDSSLP